MPLYLNAAHKSTLFHSWRSKRRAARIDSLFAFFAKNPEIRLAVRFIGQYAWYS